jgi:hypothetical protein
MQEIHTQAAYLAALGLLKALKEQGSHAASLARLRESLLLHHHRYDQWPAHAPQHLRLLATAAEAAHGGLLDQAARARAIADLTRGIELTIHACPGEFNPLAAEAVLAQPTLGGDPIPAAHVDPIAHPEEEPGASKASGE